MTVKLFYYRYNEGVNWPVGLEELYWVYEPDFGISMPMSDQWQMQILKPQLVELRKRR